MSDIYCVVDWYRLVLTRKTWTHFHQRAGGASQGRLHLSTAAQLSQLGLALCRQLFHLIILPVIAGDIILSPRGRIISDNYLPLQARNLQLGIVNLLLSFCGRFYRNHNLYVFPHFCFKIIIRFVFQLFI